MPVMSRNLLSLQLHFRIQVEKQFKIQKWKYETYPESKDTSRVGR